METWKNIAGFIGVYQVSNHGRIRTVPRCIKDSAGHVYRLRGRIRKATLNRRGYLKVELWKNNQGRTAEVHRLVAAAFIGRCPAGKEVRHMDGQRTNNRRSNLKYGTRIEQQADRKRHGTAYVYVISDATVAKVRVAYNTGRYTMRQVADRFDISVCSAFRFIRGTRHTHAH